MTVIYDRFGILAGLQQINSDGSITTSGPGSSIWSDYISKNGEPPPNGAPTFPPPAQSADELSVKSIIAKGAIAAGDVLPLLQAMVKTGRIQ
jgi:hypothetical protein